MKNVLILGLGKSGTTALFYHLMNVFHDEIGLCEPTTFAEIEQHCAKYADQNIVSKVLLDLYQDDITELCSYFDDVIFISRDIRDIMISLILYFSAEIFITHKIQDGTVLKSYELIKRKCQNPDKINLHNILASDPFEEVNRFINARIDTLSATSKSLLSLLNSIPVLQYETYIKKDYSLLSKTFNIDEVQFHIPYSMPIVIKSIIERAKGDDNWKNWFTNEDVEFYKPILSPILTIFGYADQKWQHNTNKRPIPSEIGENYFAKMINYRRVESGIHELDMN